MANLPLIVILPGWGGTHETWRDFMAEAEAAGLENRCIDLPCFGDSPCPKEVWGVEEYAEFVMAQVRGIEQTMPGRPIVLLGHSFGGQVATVVAAKYPERFVGLILSGAAIFRPKKTLKRFVFSCIAKTGKWIFRLPLLEKGSETAKRLLYHAADAPDYKETSGIKRDIFKKIIRQDVSLYLPSIRMQTLVLWGSHDRYVSVHDSTRIVDLLARSVVQIIPNAGHGLHLTHRQEMISFIRNFLSTI